MGEDEGEKVKLGLGIGIGIGVDCNYNDRHQNGADKKKKKEFGGGCGGGGRLFSAAQLLELEHQALIYRHLAAALPVPFHLLLPIWNSVAASLGPSNADSLYKHFPTFVGFSPLGFDYRHQMDPEPGRCRRTDGKKWRCSRNVVPDQKYCEQHMHRGRQRSRKHVENSQMASPSTTTRAPKNSEGELGNSSTNLQMSTPKILQLAAQSSVNTSITHPTTIKSATPTWITNVPANGTSTAARPTAPTTGITHENDLNVGLKDSSRNHAGDNCMIRGSSNNRNNFNVGSNISPGLGFSPKSVLQARQMTFLGCNGLYFDNRSGIELEPGRCRRTDGKKWRCKRDVVPNQKYCCMHVHRGAKRQRKDSQPVAVPSTSAAAMNSASHFSQTTRVPRKADCATPNTNLSMSLPASPPRIQIDEKIISISDSDTTITDTSLHAYDSGYVSS